jgi:hypothetical protein
MVSSQVRKEVNGNQAPEFTDTEPAPLSEAAGIPFPLAPNAPSDSELPMTTTPQFLGTATIPLPDGQEEKEFERRQNGVIQHVSGSPWSDLICSSKDGLDILRKGTQF